MSSNKNLQDNHELLQSKEGEVWLEWATQIQAIGQNGLAYNDNPFDRERYQQLLEISAQMIAHKSEHTFTDIKKLFSLQSYYATPKLDVRAAIFEDDNVLLVKELDDHWSLPGGWCDINDSAAFTAIKEVEEETGLNVEVLKLIALYDKLKHEHPPQIPHSHKCFFLCQVVGGAIQTSYETQKVQYFPIQALPPISMHRVTPSQIMRCFEHSQNLALSTDFD